MKRFTALLLLVLTLGTIAGCAASAKDEPAVTKPPFDHDKEYQMLDPGTLIDDTLNANITKDVLRWDTFRTGGDVGDGLYTRVFTDYAGFVNEFSPEERGIAPFYSEASFEDRFVVAVYLVANSGGWTYELASASAKTGELSVNIKGVAPEGMATQALERHVVLIAVSRSCYQDGFKVNVQLNGKTVTFSDSI